MSDQTEKNSLQWLLFLGCAECPVEISSQSIDLLELRTWNKYSQDRDSSNTGRDWSTVKSLPSNFPFSCSSSQSQQLQYK